jgi:ADP-heptose:LPS heptosyltransferase
MPSDLGPDLPLTPLVIRFGRLGDMVLLEPLLHLLHRRYGKPCRLLSRGTWSSALYANHPDVGDIWQLLARHTPVWLSPERWAMIAALRQHDGPIYVSEDTRGSLKRIRQLLRLARIPRDLCVFINDCRRGDDEHWVDQILRFGQTTPAAFDANAYPWREADLQPAPWLVVNAEDRADVAAWIDQHRLGDAPIVLLQPGNWKLKRWGRNRKSDPKFWPIECWVELLQAMHADLPTGNLVLCGSPVEFPVMDAIRREANLTCVKVATSDLPIRRLLALLERAHSMVSVDTGPAHLAAAVGCPLVILYGSYSPKRWNRRSPFGKPIINLGGPPQMTKVSDISADQVIGAWRELHLPR